MAKEGFTVWHRICWRALVFRYGLPVGIGSLAILLVYPPPASPEQRTGLALSATGISGLVFSPVQGNRHQIRNIAGTSLFWAAERGGERASLLIEPTAPWDLSRFAFVDVPVRNLGWKGLTIRGALESHPPDPGEDSGWNGTITWLKPLESKAIRFCIERPLRGVPEIDSLPGMWGVPWEVRLWTDRPRPRLDPAETTRICLWIDQNDRSHRLQVGTPVAFGSYRPPARTEIWEDPKRFFPFIDRYGQYVHRNWPSKITSDSDLRKRAREEAKDLHQNPGPADWDSFGGWASGPRLDATGHFRTAKMGEKWWLITPEGTLFFAFGIGPISGSEATPIEERDHWFAELPPRNLEYSPAFVPGWAYSGHFSRLGRDIECVSFHRANLIRKYGCDLADYYALVHRRLRSWGFNSFYGDPACLEHQKTPYTLTLFSLGAKPLIVHSSSFLSIPDPYDPSLSSVLREGMRRYKEAGAITPLLIGISIDNEFNWEGPTTVAKAAASANAMQPAKRAFVEFLRERYGEIGQFNRSWGGNFEEWDALFPPLNTRQFRGASADLLEFNRIVIERYYRTCRDAIRETAPNHLYLGSRYRHAVGHLGPIHECAKYADVLSVNAYGDHPRSWFRTQPAIDRPVLVTEFHFGALDRGPFHYGAIPRKNQTARAASLRDYVEGCLKDLQIVGCLWFQYADEPTTGRVLDGENCQIGFVDTADTPYEETIAASRAIAETLYSRRMGPARTQ